jgi:hypothetical protein
MSDNLDEVREVVLFLSMRLRALEARLRAGQSAKPVLCVPAAKAFWDAGFRFKEKKVQRLCKKHPWGILLGSWHVKQPDFDAFADLVWRGLAKF